MYRYVRTKGTVRTYVQRSEARGTYVRAAGRRRNERRRNDPRILDPRACLLNDVGVVVVVVGVVVHRGNYI